MVETIKEIALVGLGFGGFGGGVAAILNAWFSGRARLIRARRGDPEPARRQAMLPRPGRREP